MNKKNNQKFLGYGNNRKYTEKQFLFTTCSKLFSGKTMNNLLSYCGLTDARMQASEKDLPVNAFSLVIREHF